MAKNQIDRLVWLMSKIVSAGDRGISLVDLQRAWERKFGEVYPRRTFNNHREKLEDVFGVVVECNRGTNTYYIPYADDALDSNNTSNWLIDTFTVSNLLSLQKDRLTGRVSVEEVPSGHKYLTSTIAAMDADHVIRIVYEKYDGSAPDTFTVQPYAVKEFAMRWYVIGWCLERNALRVYGLDRVKSFEDTGESFRMPAGFNVDDLFEDSFGIYLPEGQQTETVTFRAPIKEARYLRDLPLHRSQIELPSDGTGMVTFRIKVIPNVNFYMELCKLGPRIEVLSPANVRQKLAETLRSAADLYI